MLSLNPTGNPPKALSSSCQQEQVVALIKWRVFFKV
jgi:hypothetical protein